MKNKEIKELTIKELREHIKEERLALTKMNLAHGISAVEHTHKFSEHKKNVARFKTELKAREIAALEAAL